MAQCATQDSLWSALVYCCNQRTVQRADPLSELCAHRGSWSPMTFLERIRHTGAALVVPPHVSRYIIDLFAGDF